MNADARIVVGYDGSRDSLAALAWAARAAALRSEPVVVATITDPRATVRGMSMPEAWWADVETRARAVLSEVPAASFSFERHFGHLVPTLLETAERASMLVVGSKGHGLVAEILRGSVSQSTARHASLPVVVVRPMSTPDSGRIVVGADGSVASERAVAFGCEMARQTGDKLVLLRAWSPVTVPADRYGYVPPLREDAAARADSALGRQVEQLRVDHPDLGIQGELVQGPAERGLVDASSSASLVVVGSRGHRAVAEPFVGSVSTAVLHKAHCPVAVLH